MDRRSPALRVSLAVVAVVAAWQVVARPWSVFETMVISGVLRFCGVGVDRVGDELLVHRAAGDAFVVSVGVWCSTIGPLLVFVAMAMAASGDRRERWRSASIVCAVVVAVNVARIVTVVLVGAVFDSAALEHWHDTAGVAISTTVVMACVAWLAVRLWPAASRDGNAVPNAVG